MTVPENRIAPPLTLPADTKAPRLARAYVTRWLTAWGLGCLASDATLVTSELVTNAAAASIGPEIAIEVVRHGATVTVRVGDDSPASPPLPPVAPTEPAEHGHGLLIVTQTAKACGWEPTDYEPGKTVWATLGCPSPRC